MRDVWMNYTEKALSFIGSQKKPALARVDMLSEKLGVSPQTIRRGLQDEGTCWRQIMALVLKQRSARLLRTMPPKEVAYALGYAEQNSFYRAYRQWHGVSISEDRAEDPLLH